MLRKITVKHTLSISQLDNKGMNIQKILPTSLEVMKQLGSILLTQTSRSVIRLLKE